jgi:hypothetical protein
MREFRRRCGRRFHHGGFGHRVIVLLRKRHGIVPNVLLIRASMFAGAIGGSVRGVLVLFAIGAFAVTTASATTTAAPAAAVLTIIAGVLAILALGIVCRSGGFFLVFLVAFARGLGIWRGILAGIVAIGGGFGTRSVFIATTATPAAAAAASGVL